MANPMTAEAMARKLALAFEHFGQHPWQTDLEQGLAMQLQNAVLRLPINAQTISKWRTFLPSFIAGQSESLLRTDDTFRMGLFGMAELVKGELVQTEPNQSSAIQRAPDKQRSFFYD